MVMGTTSKSCWEQRWGSRAGMEVQQLNNFFFQRTKSSKTLLYHRSVCVFPNIGHCSSSAIIQGSLLLVAVHILANCFYFGMEMIV